jgi:hypothetical protein
MAEVRSYSYCCLEDVHILGKSVQTIKEGSSLVFVHALIIMRKGHRPAK